MQQLLNDPQTIPFFHNEQVRLAPLKLEINRRLDKIKNMIASSILTSPVATSQVACQTTQPQPLQDITHSLASEQNKRPCLMNSPEPKLVNRCSLPWGGKEPKQSILDRSAKVSRDLNKVCTSQIIGKNARKASVIIDNNWNSKNDSNSNENCFSMLELKSFSSACTIQTRRNDRKVRQKSPQSSEITNERNSLSSNGRTCFSIFNSKARNYQHIQLAEYQEQKPTVERINVSQECRTRMLTQMEQLQRKRRIQSVDNIVRTNIIRKVDQKYAQYYLNI